ncbi:hypothetical protein SEVIR_7G286508v4 [Setaria viridis]
MAAQSRWRAVDVPIDGRSTSRVIRRLPQHDRYSCHGGHQPWKVHRRMVLASCSMHSTGRICDLHQLTLFTHPMERRRCSTQPQSSSADRDAVCQPQLHPCMVNLLCSTAQDQRQIYHGGGRHLLVMRGRRAAGGTQPP